MKNLKKKFLHFIANNRKQAGFTLIEMVVVIAIVVMLMIIIAPNLMQQKNNAEDKTDKAFTTTLQTQVELYNDEHEKSPLKNSLEPLKESDQYLTKEQKNKLSHYHLKDGQVIANAK